jgi:2-octaprenyl-6-methoxyphenol hydroxylase
VNSSSQRPTGIAKERRLEFVNKDNAFLISLNQLAMCSMLSLTDIVPDKPLVYDVAIVGGGVVGTLTACLLEYSGLKVVLIEAATTSAAADRGQAYSINQLSSKIFAGLNLWSQIRPQVETYSHVQLSDADYQGTIVQFQPDDVQEPTLGYVAEHRVLLDALQSRLKRCELVDWLCPATVQSMTTVGHDRQLTIGHGGTTRVLQAKLVIAADGSRSPLRQAAGIDTFGWRYWQSCIVAFIRPSKPHQNTAYERFQTEGPFAILPLPNGLTRIVWTTDKTEADRLLKLDRTTFLSLLQQRYGDQLGDLELVGEPSVFPVQLLHSRQYVQSGLALIGDAAHCCHPVGGQGINLGIRDAAALVEVITQSQQRGEDFAQLSVLKRYQRWRMWENLVMLAFTDVLNRTFSHRILPIVILRRLGLWVLQNIQPAKSFALKLMLGLTGRMPQIAINQSSSEETSLTSPGIIC